MSIRIRKSRKPVHGPGQLFVYRTEYVKATTVREVPVPGHQRDIYLAAMPRFTPTGQAAKALTYHTPKEGPKPAPLTAAELAKLDAFLAEDIKNYRLERDPKLVAEIRAEVEAELHQARNCVAQEPLDIAASVLRDAARDVIAQAKLFREQGQELAEGWLREKSETSAPAENKLTQLKGRANDVRQAAIEFEAALKKAGLIQNKKGGAE